MKCHSFYLKNNNDTFDKKNRMLSASSLLVALRVNLSLGKSADDVVKIYSFFC